jgi:hypothetical protein
MPCFWSLLIDELAGVKQTFVHTFVLCVIGDLINNAQVLSQLRWGSSWVRLLGQACRNREE